MLVVSFAQFGHRLRRLVDGALRRLARLGRRNRRPRGRPLPIQGLSRHLRRDIGFDP